MLPLCIAFALGAFLALFALAALCAKEVIIRVPKSLFRKHWLIIHHALDEACEAWLAAHPDGLDELERREFDSWIQYREKE
jgi:hypothetical protein